MTKRFDFCQLFSTLLKRFCPLDSKNAFVIFYFWKKNIFFLLLTNYFVCPKSFFWQLWWWWFVAPLSPKLHTALAQVLDARWDREEPKKRTASKKNFQDDWFRSSCTCLVTGRLYSDLKIAREIRFWAEKISKRIIGPKRKYF